MKWLNLNKAITSNIIPLVLISYYHFKLFSRSIHRLGQVSLNCPFLVFNSMLLRSFHQTSLGSFHFRHGCHSSHLISRTCPCLCSRRWVGTSAGMPPRRWRPSSRTSPWRSTRSPSQSAHPPQMRPVCVHLNHTYFQWA